MASSATRRKEVEPRTADEKLDLVLSKLGTIDLLAGEIATLRSEFHQVRLNLDDELAGMRSYVLASQAQYRPPRAPAVSDLYPTGAAFAEKISNYRPRPIFAE